MEDEIPQLDMEFPPVVKSELVSNVAYRLEIWIWDLGSYVWFN
jgi:hypothetical protein